ncbi:MAG: hypothetical protein AAFO79_08910, partial [Pseudomonadota bacterium]
MVLITITVCRTRRVAYNHVGEAGSPDQIVGRMTQVREPSVDTADPIPLQPLYARIQSLDGIGPKLATL